MVMKKLLAVFLFVTSISAQWEIVVIDSGSHIPNPDVKFHIGSIAFAVDKNKKAHIAYEGIYDFPTQYGYGFSLDRVLQYIRYNSLTSTKERDYIVEGLPDELGPHCGLYPSITLDNNDAIYLAHIIREFSDVLKLLYSLDGTTFSYKAGIDGPDPGIRMGPTRICVDKNGILHLLYYDETNYCLRYLQYINNIFQEKGIISFPEGFLLNHFSAGVDSYGKIHIAYSIDREPPNVYYGFYDGIKISTESIDKGVLPTLGIDKNNNIHLCYLSSYTFTINGNMVELPVLIYKRKTTQGESFKQVVAISVDCYYISNRIVFDNAGNLFFLICTLDLKLDLSKPLIPGINGLICLTKSVYDKWHAEVIETSINYLNPTLLTLFHNPPAIDIDIDGQLHICYSRTRSDLSSGETLEELVYAKRASIAPSVSESEGDNNVIKAIKIHLTPSSVVRKKIKELKKKIQQ